MNINMLITLASLVTGILLLFGPKLKELFLTNNSNPTKDYLQSILNNTPAKSKTDSGLDCLEEIVGGLDPNTHKEAIDTLIDKVAPMLIRQRLKK